MDLIHMRFNYEKYRTLGFAAQRKLKDHDGDTVVFTPGKNIAALHLANGTTFGVCKEWCDPIPDNQVGLNQDTDQQPSAAVKEESVLSAKDLFDLVVYLQDTLSAERLRQLYAAMDQRPTTLNLLLSPGLKVKTIYNYIKDMERELN